ncbi:uncharacterized protein PODANS_3_11500 [Podospora anserina S mat+]|uniref:Podospora anserina S mat+ genomic DNA chromosome 3, supercontig 3 n=1 Tax=Podospora anserina (strain S / ATCC MYA-4624 / DSM 980 / FGSC 10383) TaxID=515849 RepID=B2ACT5_PODAN|nr:uncharacterized protein PODANS_3_11500 [Podospora anserina S mat+]CAP61250.1 unnamed protein product [Podospora anserina S mat+]CDP27604.1 Putative protein of unknown function [Podospora anserina S mat+]
MNGHGTQGHLDDPARVPSSPRPKAGSRTSSSSSSTAQTTSTHSHRYHHSRCGERAKSHLSRELSDGTSLAVTPMSALLQERLERERRVESERASSRTSNDLFRSTVDNRAIRSPSPADSRPISSQSSDSARKKGLGVKEMEQTLSNLHKQNFDLKLELYHRRERQTVLEESLERLELQKAETDKMNDRLVHELEKRDKAVEEAVSMIVVLEARVEQLLREREMVRQVEVQGLPGAEATSKHKVLLPSGSDEVKTLNRMPSFVSEHSESTENLRNVYLGARGNVSSLPTMPEATPETIRGSFRLDSPTLSILSESSFVSVYGRTKSPDAPSPKEESPSLMDTSCMQRMLALESPTRVRSATPKNRPSTARAISNEYTHFHTITDVIGAGSSPLRQLEKVEVKRRALQDAARAQTTANDFSPFLRPPSSMTKRKTKQEKREALEKVLTHGSLTSERGLPPTPDTISTTTLRLYKNSNDTLSHEPNLTNEQSYLALSETTASHHSVPDEHGTSLEPRTQTTHTQPASTTAFDSRKLAGKNEDMDQLQRPQSTRDALRQYKGADDAESTTSSVDTWLREGMKPPRKAPLDPMSSVSQAHPNYRADRASPDLFSFPSSTKGWATNVMFGSLQGAGYMGAGGNGLPHPPMADTLDAISKSLTKPVFSSGVLTPTLDSLNSAPPPPNRRSSLQAKTGADLSGAASASPARPSPSSKIKMSVGKGSRARSNSIDIRPPSRQLADMAQSRAMTVPPKQAHQPPPPPRKVSQSHPDTQGTPSQSVSKQHHYPPTASQAPAAATPARPRSRGLNHFFRRSTGSADPPVATPFAAPAADTTSKDERPLIGIPSWGRRASLVDDDRANSSATPPPILRSKAPERKVEFDDDGGGVELELQGNEGAPVGHVHDSGGAAVERGGGAPIASGGAPVVGGGKRKWLNLARVGSLRNR